MEWKRSTGLWSTKSASLPAPEAVQKAVAVGGLSANKHSHGTAKIHCHLASKMNGFASWNIFLSCLKHKEGLAQSGSMSD